MHLLLTEEVCGDFPRFAHGLFPVSRGVSRWLQAGQASPTGLQDGEVPGGSHRCAECWGGK